jgi:mono/diheme cytochrome c family protein
MGLSPSINRYSKTRTSLLRHSKILARTLTATCVVALVVALARSWAQPSTPIVHAYSSESKKAGAILFHEKGCEHCHGVDGRGGDLGPDLSTVGKRLKTQRIEQQIRGGGAAMPAFGDVLQPDEIKDLVDFLHAKRKAPKKTALPIGASSPTANE